MILRGLYLNTTYIKIVSSRSNLMLIRLCKKPIRLCEKLIRLYKKLIKLYKKLIRFVY